MVGDEFGEPSRLDICALQLRALLLELQLREAWSEYTHALVVLELVEDARQDERKVR